MQKKSETTKTNKQTNESPYRYARRNIRVLSYIRRISYDSKSRADRRQQLCYTTHTPSAGARQQAHPGVVDVSNASRRRLRVPPLAELSAFFPSDYYHRRDDTNKRKAPKISLRMYHLSFIILFIFVDISADACGIRLVYVHIRIIRVRSTDVFFCLFFLTKIKISQKNVHITFCSFKFNLVVD